MADTARRAMTIEEFLIWQEGQEDRYEFIDGQPRAMTGATHRHDVITVNLLRDLSIALRGKPCRAATFDIAVRTGRGNVRRPDALVECSTRLDGMIAHEPVVLFEVLSPSTRAFDLTKKFIEYQTLDSLAYYVVVQQEQPIVSIYRRRDDGGWSFEAVSGLEGAVALDRIGVTLAVTDLYDRLTFEPPETVSATD